MKSGPIIMIEDDADDQEMLVDALRDIDVNNEVIWFVNCIEAFKFLKETPLHPFLIFCDVNLPRQTGIEFKVQIDEDPELRKKSIPFIFYSTSADQATVNEAYTKMTVQGFFKKCNTYEEIKSCMKVIVSYWMLCKHPNTY